MNTLGPVQRNGRRAESIGEVLPEMKSEAITLHPARSTKSQEFSKAGLLPRQIPGVHHIELNLRDIEQLFNTMDPSPFHEKDLDHDAEEFIFGWAQEFPRHEPVDLIVHLEKLPDGRDAKRLVEDAVHNYFAYRARLNQLEFKRLMRQGRMSLLVGLSFLVLCLLIIELLVLNRPGTISNFLAQSLTIAGWVAMWRPMEIYLYEWWPLRRRGQIFEKLSRMPVEVRRRT